MKIALRFQLALLLFGFCGSILPFFLPVLLSLFVSLWLPNSFAGTSASREARPELMRQDYLEGSGVMKAFIDFCEEIRRNEKPDQVLPPAFEKYFMDSIEGLRKRGLEDEYAEILKHDAAELTAQGQLTLFQWNVLFYRAVVLADLSQFDQKTSQWKDVPFRRSSDYDYFRVAQYDRPNLSILKSQKKTAEMLERVTESSLETIYPPHFYMSYVDVNKLPRYSAASGLMPLADGVSCPVSVFEANMGIVPLAIANSVNVYPLSAAQALFYDGNYTSSWQRFWMHDSAHMDLAMRELRAHVNARKRNSEMMGDDKNGHPVYNPLRNLELLTPDEISRMKTAGVEFRNERLGFMKWLTNHLSISDQEMALMAYFVADHEDRHSIERFCSKNLSTPYYYYSYSQDEGRGIQMMRFHYLSDLNPLLPKYLQGDRTVLNDLAKPNESEMPLADLAGFNVVISIIPPRIIRAFAHFDKRDLVEKWPEISSYVVKSYRVMCDSWKKYKEASTTHDLVQAATTMNQLSAAVKEKLNSGDNNNCAASSVHQENSAPDGKPQGTRAESHIDSTDSSLRFRVLQPSQMLHGL